MNTTLAYSIGNQRVDRILHGLVGVFETVFPNRIRCCYLKGSVALGTAVSTSDIDILFVFKGRFINCEEKEKVWQIRRHCAEISPIQLDIGVCGETQLPPHAIVQVKRNSLVIYGEDIRAQLQLPPMKEWITTRLRASYQFLNQIRNGPKVLTFPLKYPDSEGEFYGYDQKEESLISEGRQSTQMLIRSVGWAATVIIALNAKRYVGSKFDCIKIYSESIDDRWTGFLKDIHEECINQWSYGIPKNGSDRKKLRCFCRRALLFENHFLTISRDYLLKELGDADDDYRFAAVKRLGEIIYSDDEVVNALEKLKNDANEDLQQAIIKTLEKIQGAEEKFGCLKNSTGATNPE